MIKYIFYILLYMENKDIILFILVICVIYLLYKVNKKETFIGTTTSGVTTTGITTTQSTGDRIIREINKNIGNRVDAYLAKRKDLPITESIKNLGSLADKIQNANGHFRMPANIEVDSVTITNGQIGDNEVRYRIGIEDGKLGITKIDSDNNRITDGDIVLDGNVKTNGTLSISNDGHTSVLSVKTSDKSTNLVQQGEETHSLNIDTSIKFTNEKVMD